jgi:hypothetical protein
LHCFGHEKSVNFSELRCFIWSSRKLMDSSWPGLIHHEHKVQYNIVTTHVSHSITMPA